MIPQRPTSQAYRRRHCLGVDPNIFWVAEDDLVNVERARQICDGCPFLDECLDRAVLHNECGIWAGTTETERRELRQHLALQPHQTPGAGLAAINTAQTVEAFRAAGSDHVYREAAAWLGLSTTQVRRNEVQGQLLLELADVEAS